MWGKEKALEMLGDAGFIGTEVILFHMIFRTIIILLPLPERELSGLLITLKEHLYAIGKAAPSLILRKQLNISMCSSQTSGTV